MASPALAQGKKKKKSDDGEGEKFVTLHARWDMPGVSSGPVMFLMRRQ